MTLQQLEYVLALDKTRHFVRAAELCGVTQPTLSAMIQKLEDELDCKIFDRSSHPIVPTAVGQKIIKNAITVLHNVTQLRESITDVKESVSGELHIAMIPTVAPYLLPLFIQSFHADFPAVTLRVTEMHTESVISKLQSAEIDMAILATPLQVENVLEVPLYYERFAAYVSSSEPLWGQSEVLSNDLPSNRLWVLAEGHCLRNQVFNFCESKSHAATYEAGSIDTLVKIVDVNGGYTIIPELHTDLLSDAQKMNLRAIVQPEATREIALVFREDYVREGLINAVADVVKRIIPQHMLDARLKKFAIKL